MKWQPTRKTMVTAAFYRITDTNRQTNDPENVPNVVQTGEIESKGFELEGAFVFGNDVTLTASYSHREAEVTRGNIEWEVGRRLIDTPQDLASVWIAKGFQTGNDMTLRAGLGGRYVGSTVSAGPTTSIRTPGNTLADALLELQMPSWTFALNVRVHAWRLAVDRTAVPPGADRRGNRRADRAPATARLHDDAAAFAAAPSRRLRCPPLKVLWALLDLMTILVLVSGLYLWFKRGSTETRIAEIERRPHQRRGSRPMSRAPSASRSPFIAPAWTGAACFIGLVSALIGDGVRRDLVAGVHAADRTFRPRMDDARAQGLIRGSVESFESEQGL